ASRERVAARRRPDPRHFVRGHRHSKARPADEHAPIGLRGRDRLRDGECVVRIVDGVRSVGAEIEHLVALRDEPRLEVLLELPAGVIGSYDDDRTSAQPYRLWIRTVKLPNM